MSSIVLGLGMFVRLAKRRPTSKKRGSDLTLMFITRSLGELVTGYSLRTNTKVCKPVDEQVYDTKLPVQKKTRYFGTRSYFDFFLPRHCPTIYSKWCNFATQQEILKTLSLSKWLYRRDFV